MATETKKGAPPSTTYFAPLIGLAGAGLMISVYLTLYHIGWVGTLQCGLDAPGCAIVQTSAYSSFLEIPVPIWGGGWYLGVGLLAAAGWNQKLAPKLYQAGLQGMAWAGLFFTIYLTYIEIFVLQVICWWCVASAVLVIGVFALTRPWRRWHPSSADTS